jgi:uncharacterized protein (TIGR04255 family)
MPVKKVAKKVFKKVQKNYKRNFLKNVILRIDFPQTSLDFLEKFTLEIQAKFPLQEQIESGAGSFIVGFNNGQFQQSQQKVIVWNFYDLKKTKKLEVSGDHLYIEYSKYKNSEDLLSDVRDVVARFIELSKIESINRVGLRYTNEIDLKEVASSVDWSKYFDKNLLGTLNFATKTKSKLARGMSRLVVKEQIADVSFNFGIWNADFPNENVRKEFLLDYDCYSRLPIDVSDVDFVDLIKTYNLYVEKLFEGSITDAFREILNKNKK